MKAKDSGDENMGPTQKKKCSMNKSTLIQRLTANASSRKRYLFNNIYENWVHIQNTLT